VVPGELDGDPLHEFLGDLLLDHALLLEDK
jgi:hypothetical protein